MKVSVKLWADMPEEQIKELFLKNPFPLYRGTPLANRLMNEYMFFLAKESASINSNNALVVLVNDNPVGTGQVYPIPYLSEYWGFPIGGLGHIVMDDSSNEVSRQAAEALVAALIDTARQDGMAFCSTSVPGQSITLAHALEKNGFLYAEGFLNMVGSTNYFRDQFKVQGLKIREPTKSDFFEIEDAYSKVSFPSRFITDGGFDPNKAKELYVHRFKEVYELKIGKVFVAELEGRFAGAIIAIIDKKMEKAIGVKTNVLSGMGIIIHPRAVRKGISMALIEYRQDFYKSQGVKYVNFGANFNNKPMILGLDKLGLKYGSLDMTFHCWLKGKKE